MATVREWVETELRAHAALTTGNPFFRSFIEQAGDLIQQPEAKLELETVVNTAGSPTVIHRQVHEVLVRRGLLQH